ncbi:3',5'-cyclic-nucleotide phosphodiesterase [Rhodopirellula islandica]|uniref:3',5'-cyclic-nucleotide phosphodiesterase n=1 Tax=Rhodopirellula islandica TaxID=595434 RepID=A0A0J1BEJ4_RHOIS|nr:3',5'-cyclic-nucleotide phosphodiesterase [Rhodopirellula islandica]
MLPRPTAASVQSAHMVVPDHSCRPALESHPISCRSRLVPIHQIPQSRRGFLKTTAIGGGTALLMSATQTVSAASDQATVLALLSDTHIPSSPDLTARGTNMTENLQQVISEVLTRKTRPSDLIVNGDCAYLKGLPGDYQNFVRCLAPAEQAGIALHLTMGNHDDRQPLYAALSGQRPTATAVMSKHVSVLETPHANLFLLDSLFRVNVVTGELGDAQIDWLAEQLDARSNKPAIVMTHHTPQFTAPKEGKPWNGISDTEKLLKVLDSRKHVKAYLYGHSHHWSHSQRGHFHMINLPPVAYLFNKTSPNGWVEAVLTDDAMRLQLQTLDPKHPLAGETIKVSFTS